MSGRIPTVTRPIPGYLTREEAAERVGRSVRTIRSWQSDGLKTVMGRIPEADLLAWDRRMRERTGRPRKVDDVPWIRELVEAGNVELMSDLGPILVTVARMNETHPDRVPLIREARAMLWPEFGHGTERVLSAIMAGVEYVLESGGSGS